MAYGRKTGGRQKGTPNKKTIDKIKQHKLIEDSGVTPLEYLLDIMRSEMPPELKKAVEGGKLDAGVIKALTMWHDKRLEAAKAAAPYIHAKLSSIELSGEITQTNVRELSDAELQDIAASSSTGTAKSKSSEKKPDSVH